MIPGSFDYYAPSTLDEAVALLVKFGDDAKVLAGGQSLIPMMKLRLAEPPQLIDINGIGDLSYIKEEDGWLAIGAMTREVDLDESELIKSRYPILHETSRVIADPLVRNLATVGGNLAHGDPANDHPATMLALRAELDVQGPSGSRTIAIDDFFVGPLTTALAPNEILTAVRVPIPLERSGASYLKLERKVGDFAIAGVAAAVVLNADGTCAQVGIGLTNAAATPLRAEKAENSLLGRPLSDDSMGAAADLAAAESQPTSDHRGSIEYKRAMVREFTVRALQRAKKRAQGGH
ncbi:MAG: xanthine dehydrogenase family protein subunit M [Candidatus Marinimicrobia bacterium]|nr:xanthine dehydrogenase family protein subunit M [Candidatus Neomarinimicrobiota bacterium]